MRFNIQMFGGRGASSSAKNNAFNFTREEITKAYQTMREKMQAHMDAGDEEWSAKEYSNAEFLAHMEDANWHSELHQLEDAKLTKEQLTKIKNKTKISAYGVGSELTGKENVSKMIASVKKSGSKTTKTSSKKK